MLFSPDFLMDSLASEADELRHPLFQFILAGFIPYFVHSFFLVMSVWWPHVAYGFLLRCFLPFREVTALEGSANAPKDSIRRFVDNPKLVEAITEYVGFLSSTGEIDEDGRPEPGKTVRKFKARELLSFGQYFFSPRKLGNQGDEDEECNYFFNACEESAVSALVQVLVNEYELKLCACEDSGPIQVEPNLYVQILSSGPRSRSDSKAPRAGLFGWVSALLPRSFGGLKAEKHNETKDDLFSSSEGSESDSDKSSNTDSQMEGVNRKIIVIWSFMHSRFVHGLFSLGKPFRSRRIYPTKPIDSAVRIRIDEFVKKALRWKSDTVANPSERSTQRYVYFPAYSELEEAGAQEEPQEDDSYYSSDYYDDENDDEGGPLQSVVRYKVASEDLGNIAQKNLFFSSGEEQAKDTHQLFHNLFFPRKELLSSVLQDFTNRTGIYAKPEVPWRLHLLLSSRGAGVGTTAIIKAVAAYLHRDIVVLPLHLFFSAPYFHSWTSKLRVSCKGESKVVWNDTYYSEDVVGVQTVLYPEKVIYVIENIDQIEGSGRKALEKELMEEIRLLENELSDISNTTKAEDEDDSVDCESYLIEQQETLAGGQNFRVPHSNSKISESSRSEMTSSAQKALLRKKRILDAFLTSGKDQLSAESICLALQEDFILSERKVVIFTTSLPREELPQCWSAPLFMNLFVRLDFMKEKEALEMIRSYGFAPSREEAEKIANLLCEMCKKHDVAPFVIQKCCSDSSNVMELITALENFLFLKHGGTMRV